MTDADGSPRMNGYLALDPQPSMLSPIAVKVFHSNSRMFMIGFFPPKIPSRSEVMLERPERPAPMKVGIWKRMYSQSPPVWSPDQMDAYRCVPAHPSREMMNGRALLP